MTQPLRTRRQGLELRTRPVGPGRELLCSEPQRWTTRSWSFPSVITAAGWINVYPPNSLGLRAFHHHRIPKA